MALLENSASWQCCSSLCWEKASRRGQDSPVRFALLRNPSLHSDLKWSPNLLHDVMSPTGRVTGAEECRMLETDPPPEVWHIACSSAWASVALSQFLCLGSRALYVVSRALEPLIKINKQTQTLQVFYVIPSNPNHKVWKIFALPLFFS